MTYNVFGDTLNLAISIYSLSCISWLLLMLCTQFAALLMLRRSIPLSYTVVICVGTDKPFPRTVADPIWSDIRYHTGSGKLQYGKLQYRYSRFRCMCVLDK